jgi:hypothetical protein
MNRSAWTTRAAVAAAVLTLPIYLLTMNRTIGFMDRGELAAVAVTWGIPHATGYPTLMLLAGALVHLLPFRPVLVLSVLAACLVTAGSAVLTVLFDAVGSMATPDLPARERATIALLAALIVSFTMTWWQQANGFEVYALHCLLMPLVVVLGLRWMLAARVASDSSAPAAPARGPAFRFALVVGLSFANHLTTVLLAPGLIACALCVLGPRRLLASLPALLPPFALGLLPYAWLPLRSALHPRFDWGSPHTLRAFLHHVSGADYHRWMFASVADFDAQLRYIAWRIPSDFVWIGLPVAAIGFHFLLRRSRPLATFAALTVVSGVALVAGYRIPDPDAYLLTAALGIGVLLTAGLVRMAGKFGAPVTVGVAATMIVAGLALHWRDCDERGNRLAEGFVCDLLGPLPPRTLLFTTIWSQGVSPAWYFQTVEGLRPDVLVVDPDLARVSWYLDSMERQAPELVGRAQLPFERYRAMLRAAERGAPYDGRAIEAARQSFLSALAAGAMRDRAVFSTDGLPRNEPGGARVPYGLGFWLRADTSYVAEPSWTWAFRPWAHHMDVDVALTCQTYAESRFGRAQYEAAYGRYARIRPLLEAAAAFDPHIRPERVGPLPLATDTLVLRTARYFQTVHQTLLASGGPAAAVNSPSHAGSERRSTARVEAGSAAARVAGAQADPGGTGMLGSDRPGH